MSCRSSPRHQASLCRLWRIKKSKNSGWRVPATRLEQIVAGELRLLVLSSKVHATRGYLNAMVGRLPGVGGSTEKWHMMCS